jgi:hypothetical protein
MLRVEPGYILKMSDLFNCRILVDNPGVWDAYSNPLELLVITDMNRYTGFGVCWTDI